MTNGFHPKKTTDKKSGAEAAKLPSKADSSLKAASSGNDSPKKQSSTPERKNA